MRAAKKNGDPRRKAARPKEHHPRVYAPVVPWPARTRAARRATGRLVSHRPRSVGNRAAERQGGRRREKKRARERETAPREKEERPREAEKRKRERLRTRRSSI